MKYLGLILLTPAVIFAADFNVSKDRKCKLFASNTQMNLVADWHGPCKNGLADGLGVVRYLSGDKVKSVFFGVLKAGYWDQGALSTGSGYVAGRFKDNKKIEVKDGIGVEDRNAIIGAFETASRAALLLSKEFEKSGNKSSATHYRIEAEKLSRQMD